MDETKYVIKKGDKYLKDGKYYRSIPIEVDNIAEARFFKTTQGAMSSQYRIREISKEYQEWWDNYKKKQEFQLQGRLITLPNSRMGTQSYL